MKFAHKERCKNSQWNKFGVAALVAVILISGCSSDSDNTTVPESDSEVVADTGATTFMLAMEDGTKLVTRYRLPEGDGPFPTLVVRSPYPLPYTPLSGMEDVDYSSDTDEAYADQGWPQVTEAGYALVIQHTRGQVGSEGRFQFSNERSDSIELLEWVEAQSWSDGKIGTTGDSIEAILAMVMSSEAPDLVDATFAQIGSPDLLNEALLGPGGVLKLETFFPWGAELVLTADDNHYEAMGYTPEQQAELQGAMFPILGSVVSETENAHTVDAWYEPMLDYPYFAEASPSWNELLLATPDSQTSMDFDSSETDVPSYYVAAWFDVFGPSQISAFEYGETTNGEQRLLILNGTHFTPEDPGVWPIQPLLPWFDYHLKGETSDLLDMPRVIFPIANEDDQWYGTTTWPPVAATSEVWQLSSSGEVLSPDETAAETGERSFTYNPDDPVPSVGGRNLIIDPGYFDQQSVREGARADVLSYNSTELSEDILVAGHLYSNISLSSDVLDTDIIVKVMDLSPDGTATLVTEGIQRLRYREGLDQEMFMESGEVYELKIDIGHIAWRFAAGHRIAVDVSSSNFPQWDRNMNTGGPLYTSNEGVPANNVIHHGGTHMSSIELPVVYDSSEWESLDFTTTGSVIGSAPTP